MKIKFMEAFHEEATAEQKMCAHDVAIMNIIRALEKMN